MLLTPQHGGFRAVAKFQRIDLSSFSQEAFPDELIEDLAISTGLIKRLRLFHPVMFFWALMSSILGGAGKGIASVKTEYERPAGRRLGKASFYEESSQRSLGRLHRSYPPPETISRKMDSLHTMSEKRKTSGSQPQPDSLSGRNPTQMSRYDHESQKTTEGSKCRKVSRRSNPLDSRTRMASHLFRISNSRKSSVINNGSYEASLAVEGNAG
jgi:hypothetical protein